jgi:hypothetical protein
MSDAKVTDTLNRALSEAVEKVIGAVAAGAATAAQAAQSTAGAQGTVGGAGAEAGLSSQGVSSDVQAKVDVSAAEAIESFNVHAVKDVAERNKANSQFYNSLQSSNAKLYDVTATALGLLTMGSTHNMALQQQMASDHRDQNHDRQININETDLYATLAATVTAAVLAALGKEAQK